MTNCIWDDYVSFCDDESDEIKSDNGAMVEKMLNCLDGVGIPGFYKRRIDQAMRYCQRHAPWAVPVLKLVIKNGANRKETICELVKIQRRGNWPKGGTSTP